MQLKGVAWLSAFPPAGFSLALGAIIGVFYDANPCETPACSLLLCCLWPRQLQKTVSRWAALRAEQPVPAVGDAATYAPPTLACQQASPVPLQASKPTLRLLNVLRATYIKLSAVCMGVCPPWCLQRM